MKSRETLLIISVILLGINSVKLGDITDTYTENIKIIESENARLQDELLVANDKIEQYKNIINSINEIGTESRNYIYYDIPLTINEQEYIQNLVYSNNFSYELILSIIFAESRFDKNAISNSDCLGLMQLNEKYLNTYSKLANIENPDPFNAIQNVTMGVAYLNYLREYWISQGVTANEQLYFYILNSYNMGVNSYKNYIKMNNTYSRTYDQIITKYKTKLEINKEL